MQSSQFKISGFLQPFLVPKPHNRWRPILDLSKQTFQRSSGPPSHKGSGLPQYKFHVKGWTYQFKALPVGLSTAPMEFTVVAKELN